MNQEKKKDTAGAYFLAIPFVSVGTVSLYMMGVIWNLESKPRLVQTLMAVSLLFLFVITLLFLYAQSRTEEVCRWRDVRLARRVGLDFISPTRLSKKDAERRNRIILCGIVGAGLILRVGYMLYTPCNVRRHDLWDFDMESGGHAGYLLTLIQEHRLPDSNYRQYYQQPFFYLLGSVLSYLINSFLQLKNAYNLVNAAKTVSCIASSISLLTVVPLCEELKIGWKGKITALLLSVSLPSVIYASGMICPDALTMMFFTLTFYLTFRWYHNPSTGMTILLAFVYGLAIQTKISCGLMAIFTAAVFLYALIGKKHADKRKSLILRLVIFGLISFPLGLWFCVRNKILFDQPFAYVLPLSVDGPLYRGDYSLIKRLVLIPFDNLRSTPYGDTYSDYNLPLFLVKSSLFGEWEVGKDLPRFFIYFMLVAVILLSILTIAALVFCLVHNRFYKEKKVLFTAGIFLAMVVSANFFYIKYPFGCSMDFRYYIFLVVPAGLLIAKAAEYLKVKWVENAVIILCGLSALLNAIFLMLI